MAGDSLDSVRRPRFAAFEFAGADLDGRRIELRYRLTGGPDPDLDFREVLDLPAELPAPDPKDPIVAALLDGILRSFGVSYFKAAVPARIVAPPDPDAPFWNALYTEGLGEFYFRNELDPRGRIAFPAGGEPPRMAQPTSRAPRVLVLAGGGKDSAVACEAIRAAGIEADAISLGTAPWIEASVRAMGLRHLVIRRRIDPALLVLNRRGAWNGHVPISACIAMVTLLAAYAGGYRAVIAANERSANEGSFHWNGITVNHQWSKSLEFERALQGWCSRRWSGEPRYFSLLRPMSELRIAAAFARHARYFDAFTSCNANFRQQPSAAPARWCGRCPKCVFVQLILAPHLDDATIRQIFGGDFLAAPENRRWLAELVGVEGSKPFECVGTTTECRAALARLRRDDRLGEDLSAWFDRVVAPMGGDADADWNSAWGLSREHCLTPEWEDALRAYLGD